MTTASEYVLGTGIDESARLGLQHRLWSWVTHRLWERAGVRPGQVILDAGCGPGHATMELAQLVRPATSRGDRRGMGGRVVGLDESAAFLKELGEEAKARHFSHVARVLGDVQNLTAALPQHEAAFDLAYLRWVLCFVPRPMDVIQGLATVIKPGGRVVIQDYFNYQQSIKLAPRDAAFEKGIDAVATSWRARGGDPDIASRLPGMLREAGFEVQWLDSVQRVARSPAAFAESGVGGAGGGGGGGDPMWYWPDSFFKTFLPKLVDPGFLSQDDCAAALTAWDRAAEDPSAFCLLPTVFEIIAVRV